MTPKQKQTSDIMFNALSGAARRRAEQINPRKKVESKQVKVRKDNELCKT